LLSGGSWMLESGPGGMPITEDLYAVYGFGQGTGQVTYVAGANGLLLRRNSSGWAKEATGLTTQTLVAMFGSGEDNLYFASDYFGWMVDFAEYLIASGNAYIDSQSADEMRATRGTLIEPGMAPLAYSSGVRTSMRRIRSGAAFHISYACAALRYRPGRVSFSFGSDSGSGVPGV